jgi:hypothetical protein
MQPARPYAKRLRHTPSTRSCSWMDLGKPSVLRARRLRRARHVVDVQANFCVCCCPTVGWSGAIGQREAPSPRPRLRPTCGR